MSSRQDRAIEPVQRQIGKPYLDKADIAIIGNGIAGLTAAVEARRLAPDKRIVIITDQIHPTINTPALKQFAIGKLAREQLLAYPVGTERTERIHVVTARVEEIHANGKYVMLTGNRGFGYDSLLIATGSSPMGLPESMPGRNFDGVLTLHRLQDYLDFRRRLPEVSEAVVIGGGVHAIETVMNLLFWGIHVHWLIRSAKFMPRVLDEVASEIVLDRVRRAGVSIYTETEVAGVVGRVAAVAGVITNHKEMIPCQMVLSCTGTQPVATLAERCSVPLRHKRGIIVDDKLRTSVRDIYAAGDVAALKNPQTGAYEPRALWYAAVTQGRIAGAMLTGHKDLANQPFGAPWQATHLGEPFMLSVGDPMSEHPNAMTLTDTSQGGYRRMTIADDRLIGYLSLGTAQPDSLAIKRIIDEGHSVRDITKALLKGKFDARRYLSRHTSRTAEDMLISGKMPALSSGREDVPPQLLPVTGSLSAIPAARQTETLAPLAGREETRVAQQLSQPIVQVVQRRESERPVVFEEELSPFSGNLPALQPKKVEASFVGTRSASVLPDVQTEELNPFSGNLPSLTNVFVDEISPFSGNLPALSEIGSASPLQPVPATDWQIKPRNLWSYGETTPGSQGNGASQERQASKNLWSYGNQKQTPRGKRER